LFCLDVGDGDDCLEPHPSKDKEPIAYKSKSFPQIVEADVAQVIDATHRTQQDRTSSTYENLANDDPPLKKPPKKTKLKECQTYDPPYDPISHATKSRPATLTKRKAEFEATGADIEPRPAKRQVPSKTCSGAMMNEDFTIKSKYHAPTQSNLTGVVLAAAINGAIQNLSQAEDDESSSKSSKIVEVPAPRTKGKRPRAQVEVDDETNDIKIAAKKSKTSSRVPRNDVLQPKAVLAREAKECSKLNSNKVEEQEHGLVPSLVFVHGKQIQPY
jgi:hypothetical protein